MKQPKKVQPTEKNHVPNETIEKTNDASELETPSEVNNSDSTSLDPEIDAAKKEIELLQEKYNQLNDSHLRSLAEFDNYRKRTLKEKAELIKNGGEKVIVDFISIVDDMERGLTASKDAQDVQAIREGMELIYVKMMAFLKKQGVVAIETENAAFNTDVHEAITTFPAPSEDLKGKVVDCVQKGYLMNEKVIRFAKVVVGE